MDEKTNSTEARQQSFIGGATPMPRATLLGDTQGTAHHEPIEVTAPLPSETGTITRGNKIAEYIMFTCAVSVIFAIIAGVQVVGIFGIILFMGFGFITVVSSTFNAVTNAVKNGQIVQASLLAIIFIPTIIFLGYMLFFMGYIITMIFGFVDPPDVNS